MIQFATASRLDGISEYYFATKLREIAQMRAEGIPVVNLGIGSPDLPPAPEVAEALQHHSQQSGAHGYQSYTGLPALRAAWAAWYGQYYHTSLTADHVLPLIGSKEGIMHVAMTFLQPGDVALVPDPGYPTYKAASLLAGASVHPYSLDEAHHWRPDLEALEQADLSKVKLMWVNYPHMPTGAPADADLFASLIAFARKHHILLVNDNPYSFILNEHPMSILSVPGGMEVAIELNSLSKSHNMAGWRMGALLGRPDLLQAVLRFKSNMDSGQFLPAQHAAITALQLPATWYSTLNETYRQRQQKAFELLRLTGATFDEQQQGLFVWAKVPEHWSDGYALSDYLLYESKVFLTPGGIFGPAGQSYIRISLCQDVAVFDQAIHQISSITELPIDLT